MQLVTSKDGTRIAYDKLATIVPNAQRQTLEGQAHDVSSKVLAPVLVRFLSD